MTISYLITLYNKEAFIGDVLDAVLAEQAETGGEIIVYDDASIDRSPDIVEERIAANAQARLVRGRQNCGVSAATNRVIGAAAQPYIRLVDGDDWVVPGSTRRMLRLLQQHKLDFVHGLYASTEPDAVRRIAQKERLRHQSYAECTILQDPVPVVLRHLCAIPSSCFFAAAKLKAICPLSEWIRRTQDFNIFLRLACHGAAMGAIDDIVALTPSQYTDNNLSTLRAALYAEMCRGVVEEQGRISPYNMRSVTRRYAGRTLKYFQHEAGIRLRFGDKCALWYWRRFCRIASPKTCGVRLGKMAAILDRDRDHRIA